MMDEEYRQKLKDLASAVAWLRAVADGTAGDMETPPSDLLGELADIVEAATPGWAQRDGSFKVPDFVECDLKRPLKRIANSSSPDLEVLRFRPPTAGETKQITERARKSPEAAAIYMLSLLSEDKLNEKEVERLLMIDAERCGEKLQPFLSLKPLSGVLPS